MTLMVTFGTMFLAFGLPTAIFWLVMRKSAKLVIVVVSAAFVWLLSALLTSVIWHAVPPLKEDYWFMILWGVLLQEVARWLFWLLLKKAEKGLNTLAPDGEISITREKLALAAGLGFGISSSIIQFNIVLDATTGPGTAVSPGCTDVSFFVISALTTLCFGMLNIFWTIIMYCGLEQKHIRASGWLWKVVFVLASHLTASYLTLIHKEGEECAGALVPQYLIMAAAGAISWFVSGMQFNFKRE